MISGYVDQWVDEQIGRLVRAVFIYSLFEDTDSESFCAASDYWVIISSSLEIV